ncbi:MAG: hypothetical protein M3P53_04075 [Actinomycetota bacterium]|nr:hypothetical protein [Actinomycetota bacterium]
MRRSAPLLAAVLVVVGGAIHLQLWSSGYQGIPFIGPWFLANAAVSALLGTAVVLRPAAGITFAGIAFSLASLVAVVLSRTVGLLGFLERRWTDQAFAAVAAEVGAIVALAVVAVVTGRGTGRTAVAVPGPAQRNGRPGLAGVRQPVSAA